MHHPSCSVAPPIMFTCSMRFVSCLHGARHGSHLTALAPSSSGGQQHFLNCGSYNRHGSHPFTIPALCLELAEGSNLVDLLRVSSSFRFGSMTNLHEAQKIATVAALEPMNAYSGVKPGSRNLVKRISTSSSAEIYLVAEVESITNLAILLNCSLFTLTASCLELAEGVSLIDLLSLCASSGFPRRSSNNPHEARTTATVVALEPPNANSDVTASNRNHRVKGQIPTLCVSNNMGLAKDCLLKKCFTVSNSSPMKTNQMAGIPTSSSVEICLVAEVESFNTLASSLNRSLFILTGQLPSAPAKMKPYPPPSHRDFIPLRSQIDPTERETTQKIQQWSEQGPPRRSTGTLAYHRRRRQSRRHQVDRLSSPPDRDKISKNRAWALWSYDNWA